MLNSTPTENDEGQSAVWLPVEGPIVPSASVIYVDDALIREDDEMLDQQRQATQVWSTFNPNLSKDTSFNRHIEQMTAKYHGPIIISEELMRLGV